MGSNLCMCMFSALLKTCSAHPFQKIAPASLPFLFKTSLETSLLVDIIAVFSAAFTSNSDPVVRKAIREYLNWFPKVPRFQTITLCMSKDEKELCKSLIDAIGDVGGAWSV